MIRTYLTTIPIHVRLNLDILLRVCRFRVRLAPPVLSGFDAKLAKTISWSLATLPPSESIGLRKISNGRRLF